MSRRIHDAAFVYLRFIFQLRSILEPRCIMTYSFRSDTRDCVLIPRVEKFRWERLKSKRNTSETQRTLDSSSKCVISNCSSYREIWIAERNGVQFSINRNVGRCAEWQSVTGEQLFTVHPRANEERSYLRHCYFPENGCRSESRCYTCLCLR